MCLCGYKVVNNKDIFNAFYFEFVQIHTLKNVIVNSKFIIW